MSKSKILLIYTGGTIGMIKEANQPYLKPFEERACIHGKELVDLAKKKLAEQQDVRLGNEKNYARVEARLKPFEAAVKLHESNIESLKRELANIK